MVTSKDAGHEDGWQAGGQGINSLGAGMNYVCHWNNNMISLEFCQEQDISCGYISPTEIPA